MTMTRRRVHIDVGLPRDPSAPAVARRELQRFAGILDRSVLGDLELVVSELVSNALMHGQGAILLRLHGVETGEVWGEVIDDGGGFEHEVREVGPLATTGRGLLIVDHLTTRWGVHEGTTHVWFEMRTGSSGRQGGGPHLGEQSRPPQLPD